MAQACFAVLGLGISVMAPMALALVGRGVGAGRRSRAIARVAVVGYMGFLLAPPVMGGVSELLGLRASFLAVALLLLTVPLLLGQLERRAVAA